MKLGIARVLPAFCLLILSLTSLTLAQSNVMTNGGTTNTLPLFTSPTTIQNSIVTQTGTSAINVLGKLNLPAIATATSTAGKASRPQAFTASAFNSGTAAAVAQNFQLQAEPANNNTASPSGTLNLLFAAGAATPAETGLKISNKGIITFAPGQTFPGGGSFCIATGGGFGSGGTTFVAPAFTVPAKNNCTTWSGFTKTATTVILNTSGAACLSSTGKTLTLSLSSLDPAFLGTTPAADYIQLTRASSTGSFTGGSDQGEFSGTANQTTCTAGLLTLPDSHD